MKNQKKIESRMTGYTAECYVVYQLARRGIKCQKMDSFMGHYDLITELGHRIEVKASRPIWSWNGPKTQKTLMWNWNNHRKEYIFEKGIMREVRKVRDRQCDFFVFLGLDSVREVKKVFIVPKDIIGLRMCINEPVERKRITKFTTLNLRDWEGKWDLISEKKGKEKK